MKRCGGLLITLHPMAPRARCARREAFRFYRELEGRRSRSAKRNDWCPARSCAGRRTGCHDYRETAIQRCEAVLAAGGLDEREREFVVSVRNRKAWGAGGRSLC
jgi:hypothetical protein